MRKYQDWSGWWFGLRTKAMEAGATSIATLLGTNGVAAMNIPGLNDVGLNWKTALAQFVAHTLLAAANYIRTKPAPDLVDPDQDSSPQPPQAIP
jgi:hypothetical protein